MSDLGQNPTLTRLAELEARLDKIETMLSPDHLAAAITDALRKAYEDEHARRRQQYGTPDDRLSRAEGEHLRDAIRSIIREAGAPVHYREIAERLQAQGIAVNGKSKAKTVSAHLSNDERFASAGNGFWTLTSWTKGRSE